TIPDCPRQRSPRGGHELSPSPASAAPVSARLSPPVATVERHRAPAGARAGAHLGGTPGRPVARSPGGILRGLLGRTSADGVPPPGQRAAGTRYLATSVSPDRPVSQPGRLGDDPR